MAIFARIAIWIAFTVSTLVLGLILGLLAPRATGAVHEAARERIGPVIGWGVVLTIGLPLAALLVMATIVGLPLGLGTLLALGLVYGIGYTAGAWVLGRTVTPPSPSDPVFPGRRGASCGLSLSFVLGGLGWFAAVVVGLGAIAVAAYRAHRRAPVRRAGPAPPAPGRDGALGAGAGETASDATASGCGRRDQDVEGHAGAGWLTNAHSLVVTHLKAGSR